MRLRRTLAHIRWPGRQILLLLTIATLMVPFQVTLIPVFLVFKNLGWAGDFRPLILPQFFGYAYYIFLLRQFFMTIPHELSEAARIDGANEFRIYWSVVITLPPIIIFFLTQRTFVQGVTLTGIKG